MSQVPVMPDLPQFPDQLPNEVQQQQQVFQYQGQTPQPVQIVAANPPQQLTVLDIFCKCEIPTFERKQKCVGCCTACFPGWGLCCCICYYGAEKLDKCDVCLAGWLMCVTSQFIIGWVVACIVGCQMCYSIR